MTKKILQPNRCTWCQGSQLEIDYHDNEWGKPLHDDTGLFEFLILEGAQAGLSWVTVLKKRENYRVAMDGFDAEKIARYGDARQQELLGNAGIIRNRLKIASTISNAQAFLEIKDRVGSFDQWIWQFVDGNPQINHWSSHTDVPASTSASEKMSKALKKQGFRFVGETICYAFMQATGMVNDHTLDCFRHPANSRSE